MFSRVRLVSASLLCLSLCGSAFGQAPASITQYPYTGGGNLTFGTQVQRIARDGSYVGLRFYWTVGGSPNDGIWWFRQVGSGYTEAPALWEGLGFVSYNGEYALSHTGNTNGLWSIKPWDSTWTNLNILSGSTTFPAYLDPAGGPYAHGTRAEVSNCPYLIDINALTGTSAESFPNLEFCELPLVARSWDRAKVYGSISSEGCYLFTGEWYEVECPAVQPNQSEILTPFGVFTATEYLRDQGAIPPLGTSIVQVFDFQGDYLCGQYGGPGGAFGSFAARINPRTPPCIGDWNDDEAVDGDDVLAFFASWDGGLADANNDVTTDGDDVIAFFSAWDNSACY